MDKKAMLLSWEPAPATETVRIGPIEATLRRISDPGVLQRIPLEADGRKNLTYEINGEKIRLTEDEAHAYTWLLHALEDPKLEFLEIVQASRKTGLDCLKAGRRAVILSGLATEEIDDAKNG
jgi:hypothetical protein